MRNLTVSFAGVEAVDPEEALRLLELAFPSGPHATEAQQAFFSDLSVPPPVRVVSIHSNKTLVAIAFARVVKLNVSDFKVVALTVGPLAVHPAFQGRGIGRCLMEHLDVFASALNAEAIYLQGIPDFYTKFGYFPFFARCKFRVLKPAPTTVAEHYIIRDASMADQRTLSDVYEELTSNLTCAAERSSDVWRWLLGPASRSWYFNRPRVVESQQGVVGYFCVDKSDASRVREAVYRPDFLSCSTVLVAIVQERFASGAAHVDLMTWPNSPLWQVAPKLIDGDLLIHSRRSSGQLVKLLRPEVMLERFIRARGFDGQVVLDGADGRTGSVACFRCEAGSLTLSQAAIPAWLFGAASIHHLVYRAEARVSGSFVDHVSRLEFLHNGPFVFQGDNF